MLEVLLAMFVSSVVALTVWVAFSNAFKVKESIARVDRETHSTRLVLNKFSRDILSAFIVDDRKFHTLFRGENDGDADSITFTSFANRVIRNQKRSSEQMIVSYYVEQSSSEEGGFDLMRWTYPYLVDSNEWPDKEGFPLLSGIKAFNLQYYEATKKEYRDDWDTELVEFKGKLPEAVRLTIQFANDEKVENLFTLPNPVALGKQGLSGQPTGGSKSGGGSGSSNSGGAGAGSAPSDS